MLKTFINFTSVDYCIPEQDVCLSESEQDACDTDQEYIMPAKAGDVVKFIVDSDTVQGYTADMLKIALTNCGVLVADDVGVLTDADGQIHCVVTLPDDLEDCDYEITFYYAFQLYAVEIIPESSPGASDGSITLGIVGSPDGVFNYSIDGVNFQPSPTFEGLTEDEYTFYLTVNNDDDCLINSFTVSLIPVNCADYKGFTLDQMKASGVRLYQLYSCTLNDLKP